MAMVDVIKYKYLISMVYFMRDKVYSQKYNFDIMDKSWSNMSDEERDKTRDFNKKYIFRYDGTLRK